jgi:hypothetical protein
MKKYASVFALVAVVALSAITELKVWLFLDSSK